MGLAQIDELFAVANVDVSFYRLRHSTAIQVVEGSFLSLLLYVLHGRNDKATEELRSRPGGLGLSEVSFSGRQITFQNAEARLALIDRERVISFRCSGYFARSDILGGSFEVVFCERLRGFCRCYRGLGSGFSGTDHCCVGRNYTANGFEMNHSVLCIDFSDVCCESGGKFHGFLTVESGTFH